MIWMPQEISPSLAVGDGGSYGKLDFSQYMVQFASDRYVTFEIDTEKADGLKIPVTAVTEKEFYLIPLEYMVQAATAVIPAS